MADIAVQAVRARAVPFYPVRRKTLGRGWFEEAFRGITLGGRRCEPDRVRAPMGHHLCFGEYSRWHEDFLFRLSVYVYVFVTASLLAQVVIGTSYAPDADRAGTCWELEALMRISDRELFSRRYEGNRRP